MAINLQKGGSINLQKEVPGLKRVRIDLAWTKGADLDVSVFGCKTVPIGGENTPRLLDEDHFIFYNHKQTSNGSIQHLGDNRTGEGDGPDETILIDLEKLNPALSELSVVVTIYGNSPQNFGFVKEASISALDDVTGTEIATYKLTEQFSTETGVQIGSLVKNAQGQWEFVAVGAGYTGIDLGGFLAGYQGE